MCAVLMLALAAAAALAQPPAGSAASSLPARVGSYSAEGPARQVGFGIFEAVRPQDFGVVSHAGRTYASADGSSSFNVLLVNAQTASGSYSLLTHVASAYYLAPHSEIKLGEVGAASVKGPGGVAFVKGPAFVQIQADDGDALKDFARSFAASLDTADAEIPTLVLHLPEWEKKLKEGLRFAVTLPALQRAAAQRPVLDVIDFEGGAEAVTATYGDSRLVVVEFTTPQHAFDADAAINQRIAQLRAEGQPVPALYRREGNYSVFVFDAPDAAAAERLASGVKYEKDVRWLGRNPHADEIIARRYTSTMGGVIITTLITTGLAVLLCLGIGGAIGGVVFLRRRARTDEQQVYTDAGGMQRLNLEDLNTTAASAGLLRRGEE